MVVPGFLYVALGLAGPLVGVVWSYIPVMFSLEMLHKRKTC